MHILLVRNYYVLNFSLLFFFQNAFGRILEGPLSRELPESGRRRAQEQFFSDGDTLGIPRHFFLPQGTRADLFYLKMEFS